MVKRELIKFWLVLFILSIFVGISFINGMINDEKIKSLKTEISNLKWKNK